MISGRYSYVYSSVLQDLKVERYVREEVTREITNLVKAQQPLIKAQDLDSEALIQDPPPSTVVPHRKNGTVSSLFSLKSLEKCGFKVSRRDDIFEVSARLTGWILSSTYDIRLSRSLSGTCIQIRAWNTIGYDSKVIRLVQQGDIAGTRALFRQGKASPFDRDPLGRPLFAVSLLAPTA